MAETMNEDETEKQTRKERIDKRLVECGWQIVTYNRDTPLITYSHHAVREYPTDSGPVDYALFCERIIIGVIEAKKLSLGPQNVLIQAQRYAQGISQSNFNFDGFRVPFIYSTNGEIFWFQDLRERNSYSRRIANFHRPEALNEMLKKDLQAYSKWFELHPNEHDRIRPYQINATKAIEQAIIQGKRKIFIAKATGTGKTFTMVSQIHRLMKSGLALRILYLVDRRALAAQAVLEFNSFEAEPGMKFDKVYEVYSQRFRREDVEANKLDIPIHAFGVIIADECHRGYTAKEESKWREVLDHFDAIKIGLTATPAAHTVAYFGDPVFRYGIEEAVREGYLVDYDGIAVHSGVKVKGIFLKEGERIGQIDPEKGLEKLDRLEAERVFDASQIERDITSPDSNRKILEEVKKYAMVHEERYGRFPKTLIFAVNDIPHVSHSDQIVRICREMFQRGDKFVQKITGSPTVDRPLQRIREFRNRPEPGIAVTVDMLSTGVDIPALEFIVFMRPVRSRILFEQMMGRGTRRCDEIGKSHFVVFDCFGGTLLDYFKNVSAFTIDPPIKPTRPIKDIIDDIYQNRNRDYNVRVFVKRLQRISKEMPGAAIDLFSKFIPDGDVKSFAIRLPNLLHDDFIKTMKILRSADFQDLLDNYPRTKKSFWVAYDTKDEVKSNELIIEANGSYKPEDYINSFENFVHEYRDKIDAIKILLDRQSDWSTDSLFELRKSLKINNFSENNLRKAYNKELADIISIIKHAAKEEPLFTAQERVERAFEKIIMKKDYNVDKLRWLELIKNHLIENLTIDKGDFDKIPAFTRIGGWNVANRIFANQLESLLHTINAEMAAA
jgi:type I restriction enzyme R subunit